MLIRLGGVAMVGVRCRLPFFLVELFGFEGFCGEEGVSWREVEGTMLGSEVTCWD
jgi:hypothetical protein